MALFLTIVLLISCAGMALILLLKQRELRTGRMFFAGARPALSGFFSRMLVIERALPSIAGGVSRRAGSSVRAGFHALAAWIVLHLERVLEKALHVIRYKTSAPEAQGEASPFLREVAEYKKKLQEEKPE
jgi:hypothetical protein